MTGFCDNISKSVTLPTATDDLMTISKTVFSLKNVLSIPCQELRGIGIQISKLNTTQKDANEKNSLKSMFEKVQAKKKLNACNNDSLAEHTNGNVDSLESKQKPNFRRVKSFNDKQACNFVVGTNLSSANKRVHKIYDELDLSVLAELPNDIREEILNEKEILREDGTDQKVRRSLTVKKTLARKLENDFYDIGTESNKQIYQRDPSGVRITKSYST